jgi:heme-degrading monooxygenase HmoA
VTLPAKEATATVVVQTRVQEGQDAAFGRWQTQISAAAAKQPGFIEQSVMPPNPPTQVDWVILQHFSSADTAIAWLRSDLRQQLLAEAQHLLVDAHDVHLLRDSAAGVVPAPVFCRDHDAVEARSGGGLPSLGAAYRKGAGSLPRFSRLPVRAADAGSAG